MVAPAVLAAGISAASSLGGKLIDSFTSDGPDHLSKNTYQANYNSIKGKIEAAKAYGISPLYALGAPTFSPGGQSVGDSGRSWGDTFASMGADVSRAVAAKQTDEERALQALILQKAGLENEYLRAQINSVNSRTMRESAPGLSLHPEDKLVPPQRTTHQDSLGFRWDSNPWFTDAQSDEDRYGDSEVNQTWIMIRNKLADLYWNGQLWGKSIKYQPPRGAGRYGRY